MVGRISRSYTSDSSSVLLYSAEAFPYLALPCSSCIMCDGITNLSVVTADLIVLAFIAIIIVVFVLVVPAPHCSRVANSRGCCDVEVLPIAAIPGMCINASGQVSSGICSQRVAPHLLTLSCKHNL